MREEVLKMFEQLSEEDKEKIIALASALLQDQTRGGQISYWNRS